MDGIDYIGKFMIGVDTALPYPSGSIGIFKPEPATVIANNIIKVDEEEFEKLVNIMAQYYNPANLGISTTNTKFYNYEKPDDLSWLDIFELLEEGFCKIYTIGAYSIKGIQTKVNVYTELHFLQNYPDPFTIIVINHKQDEFRLKIDIQYLKAKCFDELRENIDNLPQR